MEPNNLPTDNTAPVSTSPMPSTTVAQVKEPFYKKINLSYAVPIGIFVLILIVTLIFAGFKYAGVNTTTPVKSTTTSNTNSTPETINFYGDSKGLQSDYEKTLLADFTKQTGINVNLIYRNEDTSTALKEITTDLASSTSQNDVYMMDVVWPGLFADNLVDLSSYFPNASTTHFKAIVDNNTIGGKLVGIPYYTDAGLLYYRKDLLKKYNYSAPPKTWDELQTMAKKIQDGEKVANKDFWGYAWEGYNSESLTCNAIEWQASYGGGTIIEPSGVISVNNSKTAAALKQATGWVGTISPVGVLNFQENDALSLWTAGNAAFMRNWPYAYAVSQDKTHSVIKDQFGIAILPSGGSRNADTLGGWQLGVSKNSSHKDAAIKLVQYLTSSAVEKKRAIDSSYLPTIPALYDDAEVLTANPYYADIKSVLANGAVARPSTVSGKNYDKVSQAYYANIHAILAKTVSVNDGLSKLQSDLVAITGLTTGSPQ